MSDPVTNVEIEDVLSSIRRLVSADDRPEKDEPEAVIETPDRLVLTPALRIDDSHDTPAQDDTTEAADAEMATAEGGAGAAFEDHDQDDVQDTDPEIAPEIDPEAALESGDAPSDPFVEDAEIVDEAEFADIPEHHEAEQDRSGDDDAYDTVQAADHGPSDDAHPDDASSDELTAYAAGFEEAVAARDDQWEPDGDSSDDYAAQPVTAMPWQDHVPDGDAAPRNPAMAEANEGLDPFVAEPDDADSAADDGAGQDAQMPPQDTPAAAVPPPGNAFDDGLSPDDVLDEDALRDLVAEIVRQELQGSLGERITRNVRKLVRREIQRALAAQELE